MSFVSRWSDWHITKAKKGILKVARVFPRPYFIVTFSLLVVERGNLPLCLIYVSLGFRNSTRDDLGKVCGEYPDSICSFVNLGISFLLEGGIADLLGIKFHLMFLVVLATGVRCGLDDNISVVLVLDQVWSFL